MPGSLTTTGPRAYPEPVTASHDVSRRTEPARRVALARVTDRELDVVEHLRTVADDAAGACVSFTGVVRDHDGGRPVQALRYVAHPSAPDVVDRVARRVAAAHPVDALAVSHRLGDLVVGDVALAVAVSAAHRREAFEAAEALVEAVKAELPVWKEQVFADGGREWVACP